MNFLKIISKVNHNTAHFFFFILLHFSIYYFRSVRSIVFFNEFLYSHIHLAFSNQLILLLLLLLSLLLWSICGIIFSWFYLPLLFTRYYRVPKSYWYYYSYHYCYGISTPLNFLFLSFFFSFPYFPFFFFLFTYLCRITKSYWYYHGHANFFPSFRTNIFIQGSRLTDRNYNLRHVFNRV